MTDRPRGAPWWVGLTIVVAVLAALVCLLVLWAYVPPERNYLYFAIAQDAALAVAAMWLLLGLIGWVKYRRLRLTAIAPVFALVTAVLVALSLPSSFAFAVSEGALTATAEECPDVDTAERRVGLYRVWSHDAGRFRRDRAGRLHAVRTRRWPSRRRGPGLPPAGNPELVHALCRTAGHRVLPLRR
ncbi:MAG: hypothetical protein ABW188_09390 [Rhodococcus fascians]